MNWKWAGNLKKSKMSIFLGTIHICPELPEKVGNEKLLKSVTYFLTQIGARMCTRVSIAWVFRPKSLSFGGKFGVLAWYFHLTKVPRHWVLGQNVEFLAKKWPWVLYFLNFIQIEFSIFFFFSPTFLISAKVKCFSFK